MVKNFTEKEVAEITRNATAFFNNFPTMIINKRKGNKSLGEKSYYYVHSKKEEPNFSANYKYVTESIKELNGFLLGAVKANNKMFN